MDAHASGDDLVAAFTRWAADQRVAASASARARERSLRDQAAGSATWVGLLVDLAEAEEKVALTIGEQQRRAGRLVGVGTDFVVLEQHNGRPILVTTRAISTVSPECSNRPASGDRRPGMALDLVAALSLLAEERPPVALLLAGGYELAGELRSVGEDVVTVRAAPPSRRVTHVRLQAVAACELR